jgi:hypothetical protein
MEEPNNMHYFSRKIVLIHLFFVLFIFVGNVIQAQTKGLIVRPAAAPGRAVLDPNNDGYVSLNNRGFVADDEVESELPLQRLVLPFAEPTSDTRTGPSCGFTDFVDAPGVYSSSYYAMTVNGGDTNLVFRFRIGNFAPNSKGYSILVDTDGRFGSSGATADPNAVAGNPGFEIEIILVTNFGVRLYNTDGTTNPALLVTMPFSQYAQISIANSTNCGDDDYFYDFFIPLSTIQTYFPSFNSSTRVRMVANTVINTLSALRGGISDMSGFDDDSSPSLDKSWETIISYAVPTPAGQAGQAGFPPIRTLPPIISGPILGGTSTVSGTSSEPDGTLIRLFNNSVEIGATTVVAGTWQITGLTSLDVGEVLTATAEASGKSVSELSNAITIGGTCSPSPTIDCLTTKGVNLTTTTAWPAGTILRVYYSNNGTFTTPLYTETLASSVSSFFMKCNTNATNCNSGPNCQSNGTYMATAQEPGKCESPVTTPQCLGNQTTAASPTISSSVQPGTQTISGTKTSAHAVFLFVDGYFVGSVTAAGTSWSIPNVTLRLGSVVQAYGRDGTRCFSAPAAVTVSQATVAPVVNGPILNGASMVSGTSTEAAGTMITIFRNAVSIGTTTVQSDGTWTLTGISPVLATGQNITATALATGKSVSPVSNTVTVQGISTPPVITGSYLEQGTSVSGTSSMPNGTVIKLYIDGFQIGTTTVSGGTWTVSGLSAIYYDLYAGGALTATATGTGLAESLPSNTVIVACNPPLNNLSLNVVGGNTCLATSASIDLPNSELYVIYTIQNLTQTTNKGSSVLGTGNNITLATFRLANSESFMVQAKKIPGTTCARPLLDTAHVTVLIPPDTSGLTAGDYLWVGVETDSLWNLGFNWVQWTGTQWRLVDDPPADTNDVLVKPVQTCIPQFPVVVTGTGGVESVCRNFTIDTGAIVYMQSNASPRTLTVRGDWINRGTFVPANGTVVFDGGVSQRIFATAGTEYFNHFKVIGANTRVILDVDVEVSATGVVTLEDGIVDLNSHEFTILNPSDTAIDRTGDGYYFAETRDGSAILHRQINSNTDAYLFPFGNATGQYIPVNFHLNSGNIGLAGVSTYKSALDTSSTYPSGSEAIPSIPNKTDKVRRFWHFYTTATPGTFDVDVDIVFGPAEAPVNGIVDQSASGVKGFRWDAAGSRWDTSFTSQTYQHNHRKLTIQNIDRFSWWGAGVGGVGPLPVALTSFQANCFNGQNHLVWKTQAEINNAYFLLEKSEDGLLWSAVSRLEGAGTSSVPKTYTTVDDKPFDVTYYRLTQFDFDGKSESWRLLAQACASTIGNAMLAPNPAPAGTTIRLTQTISIPQRIEWINAQGLRVYSETLQPGEVHDVSVPSVSPGIYHLQSEQGWRYPVIVIP